MLTWQQRCASGRPVASLDQASSLWRQQGSPLPPLPHCDATLDCFTCPALAACIRLGIIERILVGGSCVDGMHCRWLLMRDHCLCARPARSQLLAAIGCPACCN